MEEPQGRKIKYMGLDMYLYLRKEEYHCGGKWCPEEERKKAKYPKELAEFEKEIKEVNFPSKCVYNDYQVGYWRKANAIHNWLVENCADGVDDCREVYVSRDKAKELLDLCNKVLADHSLAESELPTTKGFFFGSQEYDEWYFEDIEYTKHIMEKVLSFLCEERYDYSLIYCASW